MSWKILPATLLLGAVLLSPQAAHAHVFIRDESGRTGAVLHINPDDDPQAGQPSNLFYDIQELGDARELSEASLAITDMAGRKIEVPADISGKSANVTYTFPAQGAYRLRLSVTAEDKSYIFNYTQRVSRGTVGGALDLPTHTWAQAALILSVIGLLVLAIVAFNRRKEIISYSRW